MHELRAAKKWSQEEFAHVSGLHRTYIGQIERGEKNISFENLTKIAGVLGVSLSELLSGLEQGATVNRELKRRPHSDKDAHRVFEMQKLLRQLKLQRAAMDQTMLAFEELVLKDRQEPSPVKRR